MQYAGTMAAFLRRQCRRDGSEEIGMDGSKHVEAQAK